MLNNLTDEERKRIDEMPLIEMLRKWRFTPIGDDYFEGERGKYFQEVMREKRDADPNAWTRASKALGWE